jgi:hypothetical protein
MKYLINAITNWIDPIAHIRQQATDRNVILVGHTGMWMIVDGTGDIKSTANNPIDALNLSIYAIN